jgi:hypothetical protein
MIFLHGFADYLRNHTFGFRRRWVRHVCFRWAFADKRPKIPLQHVPRNPLVHPHSKNTSKQYDILITRGWKHWLYAVILTLNFQDLGFRVLGFWCLFFWKVKTLTLRRDLSMWKDMRDWPRSNLRVAANMFKIQVYVFLQLPDILHWPCHPAIRPWHPQISSTSLTSCDAPDVLNVCDTLAILAGSAFGFHGF